MRSRLTAMVFMLVANLIGCFPTERPVPDNEPKGLPGGNSSGGGSRTEYIIQFENCFFDKDVCVQTADGLGEITILIPRHAALHSGNISVKIIFHDNARVELKIESPVKLLRHIILLLPEVFLEAVGVPNLMTYGLTFVEEGESTLRHVPPGSQLFMNEGNRPALHVSAWGSYFSLLPEEYEKPWGEITSAKWPGPVNHPQIPITINLSSDQYAITASDLKIEGAVISDFSGDDGRYTANLTASQPGLIEARIRAGALRNFFGLPNDESAKFRLSYEPDFVTTTLTTSLPGSVSAPFDVDIEFSAPVTSFSLDSFNVVNAHVEGLGGTGASYTVTVIPDKSKQASPFTIQLQVEAYAAFSHAKKPNVASNLLTVEFVPGSPVPNLQDAGQHTFIVSQPITPVDFLNTGGDAVSCSSSPDLYEGLILKVYEGSCRVYGTPTSVESLTSFEITAVSIGGEYANAAIEIVVIDQPEVPILSYDEASGTSGTVGVPMEVVPTTLVANDIAIVNCTVKDATTPLPSWAEIDPETCVISGTPTDTFYVYLQIVASNSFGESETAYVGLNADPGPPSLSYMGAEGSVGVIGESFHVEPAALNSHGNSVNSCKVKVDTTPLPDWAEINDHTCIIFGVPDALLSPTSFMIVASNYYGTSVAAEITISVGPGRPMLSYDGASGVRSWLGTETMITPTTFDTSGAAITNCTTKPDTPELPTWATIDPYTCVISGTPESTMAATEYTLIATNEKGNSNDAHVTISAVIGTETNSALSGTLRHTFFDSVANNHWMLYQANGELRSAYSSDAINWHLGPAIETAITSFSTNFREISGTGYVFLVARESASITLRRGVLTATSIIWQTPLTMFTDSSEVDFYSYPGVMTTSDAVWIIASHFTNIGWNIKVQRSENQPSGDLTSWRPSQNLGTISQAEKRGTLLPRGTGEAYALYQEGENLVAYRYDSASLAWSIANEQGVQSWFQLPGTGGQNIGGTLTQVDAIATRGQDVYIGGEFELVDGKSTAYLAHWDGSQWKAVAEDIFGRIQAIAISGDDIYVGGSFNQIGEKSVSRIARWDGFNWHSLGAGVNNTVRDILIDGQDVYITGSFYEADDVTVKGVARWDGSSWHALDDGLTGANGYALTKYKNEIIVGGSFWQAGSNYAANIARWDGNQWQPLEAGTNSFVTALTVYEDTLYVGGSFTEAGGIAANKIASWDGEQWASVGGGINGHGSFVSKLTTHDHSLIVGGEFRDAGGVSVDNVARWDGAEWHFLSGEGSNSINAIHSTGDKLLIGGVFYDFPSFRTNHVRILEDGIWSHLGGQVKGWIDRTHYWNNLLIVGGQFIEIGGIEASFIAGWDGSQWLPLGSGLNGRALAFATFDGGLYAAGSFSTAGGESASNIARWDGTQWHALGTGVDATVHALHVHNGNLYVGGMFSNAGGVYSSRAARWDGSDWHSMGSALGGIVYALATNAAGHLFAGGTVTTWNGNHIAQWNGSSWSSPGGGVNGAVYSLIQTPEGNLLAGGAFTEAGQMPANRIALWDGLEWSPLGSGLNGDVLSMVNLDGETYISGNFTTADGVNTKRVARWDGTSWHRFEYGLDLGAHIGTNGSTLYSIQLASVYELRDDALVSNVKDFSVATNQVGDPAVLYLTTDRNLSFKHYSHDMWSTSQAVTTTASSANPTLSFAAATATMYGVWNEGGAMEYRSFDGSSWSALSTQLVPTLSLARFLTCQDYRTDTEIMCLVSRGLNKSHEIFSVTVP